METKEQKAVIVQAEVDASPDLVWKLWTTPEDIVKWNYASDNWHTPSAVNELRKGGKFSYRMEARDGSSGFDFKGVYDNVILKEKLEYTLADGRKAKITFSQHEGKTVIVENFDAEELNPVELQRNGWQSILDNFKRYAEERSSKSKKSPGTVHQITPCLWFDNQAEEASEFYVSVFKDSKITGKSYYTKEGFEIHGQEEGNVMTVEFQINGQRFTAINGGPGFKFSEAVSFQVFCDTQEEIDYYWDKLTSGGEEVQCGWLKDKYGLSWQIIPSVLSSLMNDPARAERVTRAFLQMKKMDINKLVSV
jgi:predicted 3-demethylubiquinone-9 3-methyltransferase (glyoxalase superfamily)/uncharacterized protein YndB with AHSA1/START domain